MAYVKVTAAVAEALNLRSTRNRSADGNYILWQADLSSIPGDLLAERAAAVGGVVLTPNKAKQEIDGVGDPVEVTTPAAYLPSGEVPARGGAVEEPSHDETV